MQENTVYQCNRGWVDRDPAYFDSLFGEVHSELKRVATKILKGSPTDTLNTRLLIHTLFLSLVDRSDRDRITRLRFFSIASDAMRQILTDHAVKGMGSDSNSYKDEIITEAGWSREQFLQFDKKLQELMSLSERKARILELWYFGGMSHQDIGRLLNMRPSHVRRHLRTARAWILKEMRSTMRH